jgi:hypothetical protein
MEKGKVMEIGNRVWQDYVRVLREAMALEAEGNRPRGAGQVSAVPSAGTNQLPAEWESHVQYASHVIYHHATPIAWISESTGQWVVPDVKYGQQTSTVQKRIRSALKSHRSAIG